jgi:glycerophosphoryl diester phosphodiesterase
MRKIFSKRNVLIMAVVGSVLFILLWRHFHQPEIRWIAHAGGVYQGHEYTNSMEALNESYGKGFRMFEVDFSWTADARLVCLHDWNKTAQMLFGDDVTEPLTYGAFVERKTLIGVTPCTPETLQAWLGKHADAVLITDFKHDAVPGLALLSREMADVQKQIIPQIYQPRQYEKVRRLGYTNVIWTLYKMRGGMTNERLNKILSQKKLYAVTVQKQRIAKVNLSKVMQKHKVPLFTHPVDECAELKPLMRAGVSGFYSAELGPGSCR